MQRIPKIGVVMPSFQHAAFIGAALDSILEQDYPKVEILVMDGGSSDGTQEILRGYGDRIVWRSEKDDGQTDALIRGFAQLDSDYLTWLNSDDIMTGRSLWHVAEQGDGAEIVYGRGHYMDIEGRRTRDYPTVEIGANLTAETAFFEKGYVAQPSVYFSRQAYQSVGGLNRKKNLCMDYDLWVRLSKSDARWRFVPADMSGNRWYETTKTSARQLELYGEVIGTQIEHYGMVSEFFVQSVSDLLYSQLHSAQFGDADHVLARTIFFKAMWCSLNFRTPHRALEGLLFRNIAPAGPVDGLRLTNEELIAQL